MRAWTTKIVVNESLKYLESRNKLKFSQLEDAAFVESDPPPTEGIPIEVLEKMIMDLPAGYRTVFNLHVFEGKSHKEIASLLGIKENTPHSSLPIICTFGMIFVPLHGMKFDYWFSKRLNLRRGAPASTSTGVIIAIAGVALALMVMELSLAVSAGFKHEIERKVMGFDAPVSVLPAYDYQSGTSATEMRMTDSLLASIHKVASRDDIAPYTRSITVSQLFRRHAILKTDSDFMAVECLAHGPGHFFSFEQSMMTDGTFPDPQSPDSQEDIVISSPMAAKLGLSVGDKAYLYFFSDDEPKARRAYIRGLYKSNFGEYDDAIIYTSLPLQQGLSIGADSLTCTSLSIEGLDKRDIAAFTDALQSQLLEDYSRGELRSVYPVGNVFHSGALFFNWLDLLDTNVVVIFILMICVASFTLISSLFIIILDRVPTIGVLRALGATRSDVSRIFVYLALRLVGLGMLIGNALALGLIALQHATHFLPLDPEMYYLAYVPFEISWPTVLLLNIGVALGSWLILNLPARLAARIDPAATMRYE